MVLPFVLALLGCSTERTATPAQPTQRPDILIVDVDTVRADRVGALRDGAPVTPNLDQLAARSVRFTQAIAQGGWTMPALHSLLTGRWPLPVASPDRYPAPHPGDRTLASILQTYGWHTWSSWGGTIAGTIGHLTLGFQTVHWQPPAPGRPKTPPTQEVLDYLTTAPEPFFAVVHQLDLHDPDAMPPPYPWGGDFPPGPYREFVERGGATETAIAHYDAVLHAYDADIGRILATLAKRGLTNRTIVVFTSPHGEDFDEHSRFDHGILYDTTLRVPLLIADPSLTPRVVDAPVEGVDLAPTLLERVGIPVDAQMDGRSMMPLLRGETRDERPAFSLTSPCHGSLRTPTQKLIVRDVEAPPGSTWVAAGNGVRVDVDQLGTFALPRCAQGHPLAVEVYDLVADPKETKNLVQSNAATLGPALTALLARMADQEAAMDGGPTSPLTADQIRTVREHGYWGLVGGK